MGKLNKIILSAFFCVFFTVTLCAQEASVGYELADESTIVFSDADEPVTPEFSRGSTVWLFVRMILVLVLVVAAIYGIMFVFKRKSDGVKSDDDFLRRVSYLSLGPGKTVEVVTLVDRAFLIGVTDENISLLSEITDKELIEAMNLNADKKSGTKKPGSFADVLDMFMPHGPRTKTSVYGDSESKIERMMTSQRNNLNGQDGR